MGVQRTEFSLRALCRQIWDDLGGCDYHVLAKEAQRRVAAADRDAALGQSLTEYARVFATNQRAPLLGVCADPAPMLPLAPIPPAPVKPPVASATGAGQKNSARSSKVQAIRQQWPELRTTWIATREGQKAIGKCTLDDLIFQADLLEGQARRQQVKAGRVRELATAVSISRVARVEDLPADVLRRFFRTEAA